MATTFKTFLNDDVTSTRTLLYEAIPITGSLLFGTYAEPEDGPLSTTNVKAFTHGMFQSVYDYTYGKSSANHIFDLTVGVHSDGTNLTVDATNGDKVKKNMIYNEFAKILMGHDPAGDIRKLDSDGNLLTGGDSIEECFVISIARLLNKDEIRKSSFYIDIDVSATIPTATTVTSCAVGGRDGAVEANALLTFPGGTAGAGKVTVGQTLIIKSTDGTTVTYTADTAQDLAANKFESDTNANDTITSLVAVINGSTNASNHVGKITAAPVGTAGSYGSMTLTQDVAGTDGNQIFLGNIAANDLTIGGSNWVSGTTAFADGTNGTISILRITDAGSDDNYNVNSPVGDYGILQCDTFNMYDLDSDCILTSNYFLDYDAASGETGYDAAMTAVTGSAGLIFYQAGVVVLNPLIFQRFADTSTEAGYHTGDSAEGRLPGSAANSSWSGSTALGEANMLGTDNIEAVLEDKTIDAGATALRKRISKMAFNNTTELNSTIYYCRVNNNDFNYSSNRTYLHNSKIRVKKNENEAPLAYVTTVGLYSADNELLAVAKLSEPLKKDPTNEMVLRVRLDY